MRMFSGIGQSFLEWMLLQISLLHELALDKE